MPVKKEYRSRLALALAAALTVAVASYWLRSEPNEPARDPIAGSLSGVVREAFDRGAVYLRPESSGWQIPDAPVSEQAILPLDAGQRVTVRVSESNDRALPRSAVYIMNSHGSENDYFLAGHTDESGTLTAIIRGTGTEYCVARKEGYLASRASIGESPPEVITLQLTRAERMAGRTVWHSNKEPVSGVTVIAWPAAFQAVWRAICEGDSLHPECIVAMSGADGSFVLDGLSKSTYYTVTASAPGAIQLHRIPYVRPGESIEPIEVGLGKVFGVAVRLVDEKGAAIQSCDRLIEDGPRWQTAQAHANFLSVSREELCIAGINREWLQQNAGLNTCVLLAVGDHRDARLGPVQYSSARPGYRRVSAPVWAEPVTDGVKIVTIRAERDTEGFGSVTLSINALSGFVAIPDRRRDEIGTVLLRSEGAIYTCPLDVTSVNGESIVLDGVPSGTYTVEVQGHNGWFRANGLGRTIDVVAEERVDEVLVLPELGEIRLEIVNVKGEPHVGLAVVNVYRMINEQYGEADTISFDGPPYIVNGLPGGEYEVHLGGTYGARMPGSNERLNDYARARVALSTGMVTSVLLAGTY